MLEFDFAFKDGDLVADTPKTDREGNLIYVDVDGEETTFGQPGMQLVRDISLAGGTQVEKQIIINRIMTENPDWLHHKSIGADLVELIGMPNTRETGQIGIEKIKDCLTKDGFLKEEQMDIRCVPVNGETILFKIEIRKEWETIQLFFEYNIELGLMNYYEGEQS
ncbi:MAG: hypothetical protein ACRC5C_09545 [Bacilli bacterium]